jgi:hypothetical protein
MKLTLCLLLVSFFSHAQTFIPGTIQKDDETQEDGSIKFIPHTESGGSEVIFRAADGSGDVRYSAEELSGFTVNDGASRFLSFRESSTGKYVFAEVQYTGAVTAARLDALYIFSKVDGTNLQLYLPLSKMHYQDRTEFVQLKGREIRVIGGFIEFLKDCDVGNLHERLHNIGIEKITKVLKDYNACKGTTLTKAGRPSIRVGVIAGVGFPKIWFDDERFAYFDGDPSFFGGLEADIIPRSYHRKYSVGLGLNYGRVTFTEQSDSPISTLGINLDQSRVNVPLSVKLFLRPGQSGFFIQPAIQYSLVSSSTNYELMIPEKHMVYVFAGVGWEQKVGNGWLAASIRVESSVFEPYVFYFGGNSIRSVQGVVCYRIQRRL